MFSVAVFFVLFFALSREWHWTRSILFAFDIATAMFLSLVLRAFANSSMESMRQRARVEDEGKWAVLTLSVVVALVVLIALYLELHGSKEHSAASVLLASSSILLSWFFLAIVFTLHYAHGFYGDGKHTSRGLIFPETEDPDYWDFMYFSVTISMTFQVSDVQIRSRYLRRAALVHSIVSFFFNVIILAITVNVVAGVL